MENATPFAAASVTLGAAYMFLAGAPASYILVNAAALVSGVIVARLVSPAATRSQTFAGAFTLAVALVLLATALVGPRVDGASRWIRIAGLSLQPSLVLLPPALMFFTRTQDWLSSIGLAIMAVALALQPDRAMSGTLVAELAVIRLYRREAVVTMNRCDVRVRVNAREKRPGAAGALC